MTWKIQSLYHILHNTFGVSLIHYRVRCYNKHRHKTYIFYTRCKCVFAKLDLPYAENEAFLQNEQF